MITPQPNKQYSWKRPAQPAKTVTITHKHPLAKHAWCATTTTGKIVKVFPQDLREQEKATTTNPKGDTVSDYVRPKAFIPLDTQSQDALQAQILGGCNMHSSLSFDEDMMKEALKAVGYAGLPREWFAQFVPTHKARKVVSKRIYVLERIAPTMSELPPEWPGDIRDPTCGCWHVTDPMWNSSTGDPAHCRKPCVPGTRYCVEHQRRSDEEGRDPNR